VVAGFLNKQIAAGLGISEITVKAHRGKVMHKMDADSLAALVHMAATLGIARATLAIRPPGANSPTPLARPDGCHFTASGTP
jgi:Bacterial regulatory proteins, luxR family